jgi:hypothetical protein
MAIESTEIQVPRLSREALKKFILSNYHCCGDDLAISVVAKAAWDSLEKRLEALFDYNNIDQGNPFGFLPYFVHLQNFVSKEDVLEVVKEIQQDQKEIK